MGLHLKQAPCPCWQSRHAHCAHGNASAQQCPEPTGCAACQAPCRAPGLPPRAAAPPRAATRAARRTRRPAGARRPTAQHAASRPAGGHGQGTGEGQVRRRPEGSRGGRAGAAQHGASTRRSRGAALVPRHLPPAPPPHAAPPPPTPCLPLRPPEQQLYGRPWVGGCQEVLFFGQGQAGATQRRKPAGKLGG